MKKSLLLAVLLSGSILGIIKSQKSNFISNIPQYSAQDTIRIKHLNYTTVYSKSLHYPILVEWWETKSSVGCSEPIPRKDQFQLDPKLPTETDLLKDYIGSGYDRGHNSPAADNECLGKIVLTECFYFSNMMPQPHISNAGDWKSLEILSRSLSIKNDSIHVWSGGVGILKRFGNHNVAVPLKTWKVIYIVKTKEWMGFLFDNTFDKQTGVHSHQVDISDIEKETGFKFKFQ